MQSLLLYIAPVNLNCFLRFDQKPTVVDKLVFVERVVHSILVKLETIQFAVAFAVIEFYRTELC